jgi:hypothetical protein
VVAFNEPCCSIDARDVFAVHHIIMDEQQQDPEQSWPTQLDDVVTFVQHLKNGPALVCAAEPSGKATLICAAVVADEDNLGADVQLALRPSPVSRASLCPASRPPASRT